jgi:hypothetical protein
VGPATVSEPTRLARRWAERRHVEPIATPPVGHYRAVIPGAVMVPSASVPVQTSWIGVTAVDDKGYIPDDPARTGPLGGRPGNESQIGSRSQIRARHLAPPAVGPTPAGPVYATRADFYGRSRYRLTWTVTPPNRYHVWRAVESSVVTSDLRARRERTGHYEAVQPFADDPGFAAWLAAEFPDLSPGDLSQPAASDRALEAWRSWGARFYAPTNLDDTRLTTIANRAGNERAFTQITSEALVAGELNDEFDGRITGRYLYRTQAMAPNGLRGSLSQAGAPIHLHDVVPPRAPVIIRLLVGDRAVTVEWAANTEPDLDHYEVYRARVDGSIPSLDPRRMEQLSAAVAAGDSSFTDSSVSPAREYRYTLVAVDMAGNRSEPAIPRRARGIALTGPTAPTLTASRATPPTIVTLSWATDELDARALIERRPAGSDWSTVSRWIAAGILTFTDEDAPTENDLEYRVTLLDAAGNRSDPSAAITVPAVP